MCTVAVNIPEAVLFDTRMSEREAESFVRKMTAFGLYKIGGVSLGYCADIAGMPKESFVRFLGENGIGIFCYEDEDEFAEELANAERAAGAAHA